MDAKFDIFAGGLRDTQAGPKGDKGDTGDQGPKGDTGAAANCTVKASATTTAAIAFTAATAIYKFAPTAASTITFAAPTLAANEVYEAELWITQGEVPVALTLPTITWAGGTAQDMSKPGLYMLGLTYDGTDWFARTIQVRDDSYQGSYEDGDPGVYVYVDGNMIRSAQNAANWELDITGSTVYIIGSTTTFSGSTIGSGIYVETNKYQDDDYLGGGTISDVVLDGGAIWATNSTFVNCTFTSGELSCDGGTLTNCFIGSNISSYSFYPFSAEINGGTINSNIGGFGCVLNGVTVDIGSDRWFDCATSATDCLFLSGIVTGLTLTSGTINGADLMDAGASGDVVWVAGTVIGSAEVSGISVVDIGLDAGTMTNCTATGTVDARYGGTITGGTISAGAHLKYSNDATLLDGVLVCAGAMVSVYTDYGSTPVSSGTVSVDTTLNNDPYA